MASRMSDSDLRAAFRLTQAQLDEAKKVFKGVDSDGNGLIDQAELSKVYPKMSADDIARIFTYFDADGNKKLDFQEFCTFTRAMRDGDES